MGIINWYFQHKKASMGLNLCQSPKVALPDDHFDQGAHALFEKLQFNLAPPLGGHSDIWTRPAPKFPGAYLWDSSFIVQAWKYWDPEIGLRALKPFVEFQQPNGRMPHMVFWGKKISALSNPPFLAWAVKDLLRYHPDEKWAQFYIDPITRFMDWRKIDRFDENYGLYFWKHSYESGIDNTPRFTSRDESEDYGVNHLGAIDLNAEIVLQHQSLLEIINRFDPDHTYKPELQEELTRLSKQIQAKLWDSKAGIFGDLDFETGTLRTIDTIASYFPLIITDLNSEIKAKMIENLKDPRKYNTLAPTPTVARDSPEFIKDMWRGPIWTNTSYLVVKALESQGETELAGDFAYRICKAIYETYLNEGSFYEFYDPERYDLVELDRKKGNLWKKISLGSKPVKNFAGWTADANAMLLENVIGIQKNADEWVFEPHLPKEWLTKGARVELGLPWFMAGLVYEVQPDGALLMHFSLEEKEFSTTLENHTQVLLSELK